MAIARNEKDAFNDGVNLLITLAGMLFTLGAIPFALILGPGGTGDVNDLTKFAVLGIIAIFGATTYIVLKAIQFFVFTQGDGENSPYSAFSALNHDPEAGLVGLISPKWGYYLFGSQGVLAFGTLFLFTLAIILSPSPIEASQQFIGQSAIPFIDFAPGEYARIGLSMFPAVDAETLFVGGIASLLASLAILPFTKQKREVRLLIYLTVFLIAVTFSGFIFHQVRYGGSDLAVNQVLKFWFLGGLVTVITGSIIVFRILHYVNNFTVATLIYQATDAFGIAMIAVVLFSGLFFLIAVMAHYIRIRNNPELAG